MTFTYKMTQVEDTSMKEFSQRHFKECKAPVISIHLYPTGIGTKVVVECPKCKGRKDITEYERW